MAFSQKYSGKILVPWYNNFEWQQVCNYLRTNNSEDWKKVLYVLKIWKTRTPLLSAGVEGTLIILETLSNENKFSGDQIVQIYAVSLLRFLNLCATNSDRQGTFQKTAHKNALPKWLIDIRHEIAHGHKLPAKSVLEIALKESLKWLIEKYWDMQDKIMDYVIDEPNKELADLLRIYIYFNLSIFYKNSNEELNNEYFEKVSDISKKLKLKRNHNLCDIIATIEELLQRSLIKSEDKLFSNIIEIIVSENGLLNFTVNYDMENGLSSMPKSFRNVWTNLINIIADNGLLNQLLNELFKVTCNDVLNESVRLKASLWIHEIFYELNKVKDKEVMENTIISPEKKKPKITLNFFNSNFLEVFQAEAFEEKILNLPNIYTLNYLESVLNYNKNSSDFINDIKQLVSKFIFIENDVTWRPNQIFTANDIPFAMLLNDHLVKENEWKIDNTFSGNRWIEIKDKTNFSRCPLGVLPQQERETNPLIEF